MQTNRVQAHWRVMGNSIKGAAHKRTDLPNQDAIAWDFRSDNVGENLSLILALSDGHGGVKYIRSDKGSQIAVQTAISVLQEFLTKGIRGDEQTQTQPLNLSRIKRTAEDRLPKELVRTWEEQVKQHYRDNPLTRKERSLLIEREGVAAEQAVRTNPVLAYGATLLVVAVTPTFMLYLQLGDGDIVTVSDTGEVSWPLPEDQRLFANETTSLCTRNAWRDFRFRFQPLEAMPLIQIPALILASTDGYSNSYRDQAAFLQVGPDFLHMIGSDGLESVEKNLGTWLDEVSQKGSGDDVTVGIICREDVIGTRQHIADGQQDNADGPSILPSTGVDEAVVVDLLDPPVTRAVGMASEAPHPLATTAADVPGDLPSLPTAVEEGIASEAPHPLATTAADVPSDLPNLPTAAEEGTATEEAPNSPATGAAEAPSGPPSLPIAAAAGVSGGLPSLPAAGDEGADTESLVSPDPAEASVETNLLPVSAETVARPVAAETGTTADPRSLPMAGEKVDDNTTTEQPEHESMSSYGEREPSQ